MTTPLQTGLRACGPGPRRIDSSLRALTGTPLGPWLLLLVAIGLIMFGLFSCCEAKWLRL